MRKRKRFWRRFSARLIRLTLQTRRFCAAYAAFRLPIARRLRKAATPSRNTGWDAYTNAGAACRNPISKPRIGSSAPLKKAFQMQTELS